VRSNPRIKAFNPCWISRDGVGGRQLLHIHRGDTADKQMIATILASLTGVAAAA
jgi:hypothetical protein